MKKHFFIFFIFFSLTVYSQNYKYNISGMVKDNDNRALPFAEIILRNQLDSLLVNGTISDEKGSFLINRVISGKYLFSIHHIGFEIFNSEIEISDSNLIIPEVVLIEKNEGLEEITITGQRRLIKKDLNKTILDIENSIFKTGENSYRLLNIIPEIEIDGIGNIVFRGLEGVNIYINGKKVEFSRDQLMGYLKSIPSESIKTIEFSSVSSAEFDADNTGAVINIVLKEEYTYGFTGSIFSTFTQNRFSNYVNGIFLNYRKGKFNFQSNYIYINGSNFSDNIEIQESEALFFTQDENYKEDYDVNILKFGVDFHPLKNHILSVNYEFFKFNTNTLGESVTIFKNNDSNPVDSTAITSNLKKLFLGKNTLNTNYRIKLDSMGSLIDIGYSYVNYSNKSNSKINSTFFDSNGVEFIEAENTRIDNPLNVDINTYNIDWKKNINKNSNLNAGLKYSYSLTDNKIDFFNGEIPNEIINLNRTDNFSYDEKIVGIYASYKNKIEKFRYKLGLRSEYTSYLGTSFTSGIQISRNKWDFFPSIFAQQEINEDNSINFSFARKISRPSFQLLNPFEDIEDPFFMNRGNPELLPYFSSSYELTYSLKSKYTFILAHNNIQDKINNVYISEGNQIISTYDNINNQKDYLASINIPIKISSWYNMKIYSNLRYRRIDILGGNKQSFNKLIPYLSFGNKFNFSKSGYYFEIKARYLGKSFYSIYDLEPQGSIDLSFRKALFKDKLTLSINSSDPFNLKRIKINIVEGNFTRRIQNFLPTRTVSFSLSYNFSSGKKSTNRENINSPNDEEVNRLDR